MAALTGEGWRALGAVLLVEAARTPTQRMLATRFAQELQEDIGLTDGMRTLIVGLEALLSNRASASGVARTTSPSDSA